MYVSAIILAAGKSSRMGRPKALLKWKGKTFLENICHNLEKAGVEEIVIVTNKSLNSNILNINIPHPSGTHQHERKCVTSLAPVFAFKGGISRPTITINPNPEQGMLSSFRCGLRALESTDANVMLCLTDHPMVKIETYKSLIKTARKDKIIIPKFNKRRGHPVIFGADFILELLENDCPEGARSVVRAHPESVEEILVDDSGILLDIDTPADARKAGIDI